MNNHSPIKNWKPYWKRVFYKKLFYKKRQIEKKISEFFSSEFSILSIESKLKIFKRKTRKEISHVSEISEISEFSTWQLCLSLASYNGLIQK